MILVRLVLFSATILVTLVLGVCEDDGDNAGEDDGSDYVNAIAVIANQFGVSRDDIPVFGDEFDCTLFPSGPQASLLTPVPGRCLYDAEPQGEQWLVTFHETWFCNDFLVENAPGFPPCVGLTGFHEWQYTVDLQAGTSELIDERGQFAPDMIR